MNRVRGVRNGPRGGSREGFSLVELLVAIVIGALLMGAVYQVLVSNQRVSAVQREQVQSQQALRAGLSLLAQELREVSASGGDLLVTDEGRVGFRAFRAYGVVCEVGGVSSRAVTVAHLGRSFRLGESLYVFADGDPGLTVDDEWLISSVSGVQTGHLCGSGDGEIAAEQIILGGLSDSQFTRVRRGAPVRAWEEVEYGLEEFEDGWHLARALDGSVARLVGPLEAGVGLEFEYLAVDGMTAGDPSDVARVRITLRTASPARDEWGHTVADTLTTAVFLRN